MIDRILNTIRKNNLINNGESIIVGLSGGPDSVCLIHALFSVKEILNIKIFAVHINHMLRGAESDEDERYAAGLCEKLGIDINRVSVDIQAISRQKKISLEEAGREARYAEFEDYADKVGASKIAVAHNKNDQAETVLMRMMRGTGLEGLKGMDYIRGKIIRPLLDIERESIEKYCEEFGLNPRTDSSNLESVYTRNKIRLELIPFINNLFNTDIIESVHRMTNIINSENDYLEKCSVEYFHKYSGMTATGEVVLEGAPLMDVHIAIVKRVIRLCVKSIKGDLKGIENVHLESILDLLFKGRTGAVLHLTANIHVTKSYNKLKFFVPGEKDQVPVFCNQLIIPGTTKVDYLQSSVHSCIIDNIKDIEHYKNIAYNSLVQFFDYDKINCGIHIRNRLRGDIFRPLKSNGTKKLKEYFIDNKIPRENRDKIPLIAIKSEIVWIIGHKISDKFKVSENTKRVLKLIYNV